MRLARAGSRQAYGRLALPFPDRGTQRGRRLITALDRGTEDNRLITIVRLRGSCDRDSTGSDSRASEQEPQSALLHRNAPYSVRPTYWR